jgi:hypothetical protein
MEAEDRRCSQIGSRAHRLAALFRCLSFERPGRTFRAFFIGGPDESLDDEPLKNEVGRRDSVAGDTIF